MYYYLEEKKIISDFISKGYLVFDIINKKELISIKKSIISFIKKSKYFKKINNIKNDEEILNNIHKLVKKSDLNNFRLDIYNQINKKKDFHKNYYFIGKYYLDILCGNELAMQKLINLSIQLPKDKSSILPIHSDVWAGDSPFELVLWLPLVDCKKTKSMFILDPKENLKVFKNFNKINSTDQLYKKVKNKLKWIDIKFGQGLIFTQNLMHGNVSNLESTSRWSFNCRFKSILSPYNEKSLGDFFKPITVRPATTLGISYENPK